MSMSNDKWKRWKFALVFSHQDQPNRGWPKKIRSLVDKWHCSSYVHNDIECTGTRANGLIFILTFWIRQSKSTETNFHSHSKNERKVQWIVDCWWAHDTRSHHTCHFGIIICSERWIIFTLKSKLNIQKSMSMHQSPPIHTCHRIQSHVWLPLFACFYKFKISIVASVKWDVMCAVIRCGDCFDWE